MNPELKAKWIAALQSGRWRLSEAAAIRVVRRIGVTPSEQECWVWTGTRSTDGYGRFEVTRDGKSRWLVTHRVLFLSLHPELDPKGRVVCHACDNPSCVNPAHLWLGTVAENNRDRAMKGRNRDQRGEKSYVTTLTAEDVHEIRRLYHSGSLQRVIANRYGVSKTSISVIVLRKTWAHI